MYITHFAKLFFAFCYAIKAQNFPTKGVMKHIMMSERAQMRHVIHG